MESERILGIILDLGAELIRSGAETHRVEDSLYRLFGAYGFTGCNIWVVPSNIQATAHAPEGTVLTQIRHVRGVSMDLSRLDRLNALCRRACGETPDAAALGAALEEIRGQPGLSAGAACLAACLAGAGFGVFFGCGPEDVSACCCASMLIALLGRALAGRERNPLALNFLISCAAESLILLLARAGLCARPERVTIGAVMLVISALGATNGLRDLVHLDTLSGVMNLTLSFTGAAGIALGVALPLALAGGADPNAAAAAPAPAVTLISCVAACAGFALWFNVRGRRIAACAGGAGLTWACCLLARRLGAGEYAALLCASAACALYAQAMARAGRAPATVYQTISVFPLIPGAALYHTMAAVVAGRRAAALERGGELFLTCSCIVLGFMAAEAASRYIWRSAQEVHT